MGALPNPCANRNSDSLGAGAALLLDRFSTKFVESRFGNGKVPDL